MLLKKNFVPCGTPLIYKEINSLKQIGLTESQENKIILKSITYRVWRKLPSKNFLQDSTL